MQLAVNVTWKITVIIFKIIHSSIRTNRTRKSRLLLMYNNPQNIPPEPQEGRILLCSENQSLRSAFPSVYASALSLPRGQQEYQAQTCRNLSSPQSCKLLSFLPLLPVVEAGTTQNLLIFLTSTCNSACTADTP